MNKIKLFSIAFLATVSFSNAQDIESAKKAIDAEQFEKAKTILKSFIKTKPTSGKATFLLGNVYIYQNVIDSAKISFQKGLTLSDDAKINYIGLGHLDLINNNATAAQSNFDLATKDVKKKDFETYIYVAKAMMGVDKPNFKNALSVLEKAKAVNPQDAQLQITLGDAFFGDKNQNEAYVSYRNAFQADPSLIRAKMQQAVLLKRAKAYPEAVKSLDEIVVSNAGYGPVYRELAETYYYWGANEPKNYTQNIQKALAYYEKYMSLTDYSLASRMRHADFLILAKDYKALEAEANQMKALDKVNPRILRYLGYAAYENGNTDAAINALESFLSNASNKIIARDYLYLGLAKIKKANNLEAKTIDAVAFKNAVADIKKSVEMEISMTNDLSDIGKKFYEQKMYKEAAAIYEIAVSNPNSKNYLLDNFYLGNSIYFDNTRKEVAKPDFNALLKADVAFGNIITASPNTQDAYIFRARTNRLLEKDDLMAKYYEDYVTVVTNKGPEELAKPATKTKVVESYNNIAAHYANTNKAKAKEFFNKTLSLDPANKYALDSLKTL